MYMIDPARSLSSVPLVFAQAQGNAPAATCPPDQKMTEIGCLSRDPVIFITQFYGVGLSLIGGVALLFIIIGGYTIMTSRGNPEQLNTGKSYIFYAILGLLLAIFGYLFIEIVVVDMLQIPGWGR